MSDRNIDSINAANARICNKETKVDQAHFAKFAQERLSKEDVKLDRAEKYTAAQGFLSEIDHVEKNNMSQHDDLTKETRAYGTSQSAVSVKATHAQSDISDDEKERLGESNEGKNNDGKN